MTLFERIRTLFSITMSSKQSQPIFISLLSDSETEQPKVPEQPKVVPVPEPPKVVLTLKAVKMEPKTENVCDLTFDSEGEPIAKKAIIAPCIIENVVPTPMEDDRDKKVPKTETIEPPALESMEIESVNTSTTGDAVEKPKKTKKTKKQRKTIVSDTEMGESTPQETSTKTAVKPPKAKKTPYGLDERWNIRGKTLHILSLSMDESATCNEHYKPDTDFKTEFPTLEEGTIKTCLDALNFRVGLLRPVYQNYLVGFIKAMQTQEEVKAAFIANRLILLTSTKAKQYTVIHKKRLADLKSFVPKPAFDNGYGDIWFVLRCLASEMETFNDLELINYFKSLEDNHTDRKRGIFVMISYLCRNKRKDAPSRMLAPIEDDVAFVNDDLIIKIIASWGEKDVGVIGKFYESATLSKIENKFWKSMMSTQCSLAFLDLAPSMPVEEQSLYEEAKALLEAPSETPKRKSEEPASKEEITEPKKKVKKEKPKKEVTKKEKPPKENIIIPCEPLPTEYDIKNLKYFGSGKEKTIYVTPNGLLKGPFKDIKMVEQTFKVLDYLSKNNILDNDKSEILTAKFYKDGEKYYIFYPLEITTKPEEWVNDEMVTFGLCSFGSLLKNSTPDNMKKLVDYYFGEILTALTWFTVLGIKTRNFQDNVFVSNKDSKMYFLAHEKIGTIKFEEKKLEAPTLFFLNKHLNNPDLVKLLTTHAKKDSDIAFCRLLNSLQVCLGCITREEAERDTENLPPFLEGFKDFFEKCVRGEDKATAFNKVKDQFGQIQKVLDNVFSDNDDAGDFSMRTTEKFVIGGSADSEEDDEDYVPVEEEIIPEEFDEKHVEPMQTDAEK